MKVFLAGLLVLGVAGCQTAPQQRWAGIETEANSGKVALDTCVNAVRDKPEYAKLFVHFPKASSPSLTQLSDQSKITEADKVFYMAYQADLRPCRQARLESFSRMDQRLAAAYAANNADADKTRVALIQRKLSWGEAVGKLNEERLAGNTSMQAVRRNVADGLEAQHNAEVGRRAAIGAALSAAAQQMNENTQRQQLINAVNRPVRTNCNRIGDQVNCTTQ